MRNRVSIILACLLTLSCGFSFAQSEMIQYEVIKDYHPNGKLKSAFPYSFGKKDGVAKIYYSNGALWKEIPYYKGEIEGTWKTYLKTGKLAAELHFKEGRKHGIQTYYRANGQLRLKVPFYKGKEEGVTKYYDRDGKVAKEEFYEDGILLVDLNKVPKPTQFEFEVYQHLTKGNPRWSDAQKKFNLTRKELTDLFEKFQTFQKLFFSISKSSDRKVKLVIIKKLTWEEFEKIFDDLDL